MHNRIFFFSFLFVASSLVLPHAAHAAIPFFGPIVPPNIEQCAAGWASIIVVTNNIIEFLLTLLIVFVAPIMIAYAGFLFVVNPVNPSEKQKAKSVLTNTILGIVISLSAWLIVDAVMAALYNPSAVGSTWSSIVNWGGDACLRQTGSIGNLNQGTGVSTGGAVTVVPGSGDEQAIRQQLAQAGVSINHDPCPAGSDGQGCTNVAGMQAATVSQIINIANSCGNGCSVIVTGGTEPGHASGTYSHGNGYKVDLSQSNSVLNSFLQTLPLTGQRGGDSGGPIRSTCGNQYVQESNHWDITVHQVCSF